MRSEFVSFHLYSRAHSELLVTNPNRVCFPIRRGCFISYLFVGKASTISTGDSHVTSLGHVFLGDSLICVFDFDPLRVP